VEVEVAREGGVLTITLNRPDKLNAFDDAMHAGFRDACMATRVRATQREQVMDERMRCLHRRGAELDALLDVVAHPDDAVLTNASSLASNLTSV